MVHYRKARKKRSTRSSSAQKEINLVLVCLSLPALFVASFAVGLAAAFIGRRRRMTRISRPTKGQQETNLTVNSRKGTSKCRPIPLQTLFNPWCNQHPFPRHPCLHICSQFKLTFHLREHRLSTTLQTRCKRTSSHKDSRHSNKQYNPQAYTPNRPATSSLSSSSLGSSSRCKCKFSSSNIRRRRSMCRR